MIKAYLVFIFVLVLLTWITAKITYQKTRKGTTNKMWKVWSLRSMYWQAVILISGSLTYIAMMLLRSYGFLSL